MLDNDQPHNYKGLSPSFSDLDLLQLHYYDNYELNEYSLLNKPADRLE